jgi:hypothetical protein
MINTLKDTLTEVRAMFLGYKYIADFDYSSLLEMKLNYMTSKGDDGYGNIISIELINSLLHHLTFSCNVQNNDPSIFILLEANGYKLLIDNDSFKHLSKSLDSAFNVWTNNIEGDNLVIIYNSIINNLKSIKQHHVVCISNSIIDIKHIKSNTNNKLLNISKSYINVENDLYYSRDEIYYRDNKKIELKNSIIVADDVNFRYDNGSQHLLEGYNIKCNGSKVVMYLDKDSDKIGSKIIHADDNILLHVYLRKPISYDDLYAMIVSTTFHSLNNITIYYGTNNTGWLTVKPNKEIDFILTTPKLLNSINTILRKNNISIPDTMSIYSAKDVLELMYKIIRISDDKESILEASEIKIVLNTFIKNGIEKLDYTLTTES